jgi:hypothetical protein
MEKQSISRKGMIVFLGILVALMVLPLTSCARKIAFLNSSVVPAAQGYVKIKRDKNKNYVIQVTVSNLAEVERLQSSNTTYIVWAEVERNMTKNIGQLKSGSGFMSKNLKAQLSTVSSFSPSKVFITAESDPSVSYPSQVILTTDNF